MTDERVTLADDRDWELLRSQHATTVIDPMIVRVADLFARGAHGADSQTWNLIRSNLEGLAAFMDALILEPGIPVFDYWYTARDWMEDLPLFNYTSPVVVPVGIEASVWGELGAEAVITMGQKPRLPEGAAAEIANNLRLMRWSFITSKFGGVDLSGTRTAGDASGEALVNSYLYVALLFARYAWQLGDKTRPGTQILSPGQSQMFIATAAAEVAGGPRPLPEGALFGQIEDVINRSRPGYERTWRSDRLHFLPYLLTMKDKNQKLMVRTPADLFREALVLRQRSDVSDYRKRLNSAQATLETGLDDASWAKDLQRASEAVQAALNVKPNAKTFHINIGWPPSVGIGTDVDVSPLLSWLISAWPGKGYHRVLSRLATAQALSAQIDRRLETIWRAA